MLQQLDDEKFADNFMVSLNVLDVDASAAGCLAEAVGEGSRGVSQSHLQPTNPGADVKLHRHGVACWHGSRPNRDRGVDA